ncbi:MAG: glycosyltransferase family 39 protein [Candidatus Omnitrophota bacterium]
MKRQFNVLDTNIITYLIIGVMLPLLFITSLNRQFDYDEFEVIHSSWKISKGEVIYKDFFQHHNPLLYYCLVPFITFFGERLIVLYCARIFIFILFLSIVFISYLLAKKVADRDIALISTALLLTTIIFTGKAIEIRPDVPQVLFSMLSVLFLYYYFDKNKVSFLIFSALALSVSFLFLQRAVFFIMVLGCLFIFKLFKKEIGLKECILYLFIFFCGLCPYLVYLIIKGSVSEYMIFNWIFNAHIKGLSDFTPFAELVRSLRKNTILWMFYITGMAFHLRNYKHKSIGLFSIGLLLTLLLTKSSFQQYYMMAMPFIAIISSLSINRFFGNKRKIMCFILILLLVTCLSRTIKYAFKLTNKDQLKKVSYVLENTDPKDFVYDGDARFNLFRKDLDFFWYALRPNTGALSAYRKITPYSYDIYSLIGLKKPKIISDYYIEDIENKVIRDNYIRSAEYRDLYIRRF